MYISDNIKIHEYCKNLYYWLLVFDYPAILLTAVLSLDNTGFNC